MTEPQVWVLIGVFAAAMLGTLGLVIPLVNHGTRSAVDGVRSEMIGLREAMVAGFDAVDAKFEVVNAKLEHLDRDVSTLMKRESGLPD